MRLFSFAMRTYDLAARSAPIGAIGLNDTGSKKALRRMKTVDRYTVRNEFLR
ncbi:MAG: hypothetical protein ACI81O_000119 [Cyclobacteriaceae bacterium]|jgi:hypothetical protein